jgi:hypothetical protein
LSHIYLHARRPPACGIAPGSHAAKIITTDDERIPQRLSGALNLSTQGEMNSQIPATIFTHSSQGSALARAAIDKTAITIVAMHALQVARLVPPLPRCRAKHPRRNKEPHRKQEVEPLNRWLRLLT